MNKQTAAYRYHDIERGTISSPIEREYYCIRRSRWGWLLMRFEGGPHYPEMVEILRDLLMRQGALIKRGEQLSGIQWLARMEQCGVSLTQAQRTAVQTLLGP